MKANIAIMWIIAAFFFVCSGVYTYWAIIDTQEIEWVGTIAFALAGAMGAMIAAYLWWSVMRPVKGHVYPEDRLDAEIDDGDPELGHFAPWSWWPIALAAAISLFVLGIAVSIFMLPLGLVLIVITMVGWVFEYYRGNFVQR